MRKFHTPLLRLFTNILPYRRPTLRFFHRLPEDGEAEVRTTGIHCGPVHRLSGDKRCIWTCRGDSRGFASGSIEDDVGLESSRGSSYSYSMAISS